MKTKHVLFLSLSLFGGVLASCSHSNEIQITGSVKNLAGGTIVYQKSIDGMFNSQAQDTLWLNADSTFSLTLPGNGYEQIRLFLWGKRYLGSFIAEVCRLMPQLQSLFQYWKARMKKIWKCLN